jgi:hypothetical protein
MGTNRADIREIVLEVLAETRESQKAIALNAGCPQSDLSNALAGKQRLDAQWLLDQDAVFVERVLTKVRSRLGLVTDNDARGVKIARISELLRLILEVA